MTRDFDALLRHHNKGTTISSGHVYIFAFNASPHDDGLGGIPIGVSARTR